MPFKAHTVVFIIKILEVHLLSVHLCIRYCKRLNLKILVLITGMQNK